MNGRDDLTKPPKGRESTTQGTRPSPDLFELTIRSLRDAVFIIDAETATITECNPAASEMFGYSREEMLGRRTDFLHADQVALEEFREHLYATAEKAEDILLPEFRMKRKDGTVFPTEHSVRPLEDEEGRRIGWADVVRDISEREAAAEAIRREEALLRALIENLPIDFWARDQDMCCTMQSNVSRQRWGEIKGKSFSEQVVDKQTLATWQSNNKRALAGETIQGEVEFTDVEGRQYHCHQVLAPIMDAGQITGILGVNVDMTERKRMEEALRASEEKYRTVFSVSPEIVYLTDTNGNILDANPTLLKNVGMSLEEIRQTNARDFFGGEDMEELEQVIRRLQRGEEIQGFEVVADIPGKGKRVYQINAVPMNPGAESPTVLSVARDITDRRRMEEALRASEEEYRLLYDSASVGLVTTSIEDGRVVQANDEAARIFGYASKEEFAREFVPEIHYTQPGDREALIEALRTGGDIRRREALMRRKDGSHLWVEFSVRISPEKGWIEAALMDIDDRRRMEVELQKFKSISDNANYGTAMSDVEGTLIYVNEYFAQLHGYKPEELIGKNLSVFHTKEQMKDVAATNQKLKDTGSFSAQEVWHKHRDGAVFPMLMNAVVISGGGPGPSFLATTAIDITQLKQAEDALRKSEQKYRLLVETTNDMIFTVDFQGNFLFTNQAFERILGFSDDEMKSINGFSLVHPDDLAPAQEQFNRLLRGESIGNVEYRYGTKSGEYIHILLNASPLVDSEGQTIGLLGVARDVTQLKHAEDALRASEEQYRVLVESSPNMILRVDKDARTLFASKKAGEVFGKRGEDLVGKTPHDLLPADVAQRRLDRVRKVLTGSKALQFEDERDGRSFVYSIVPLPAATPEEQEAMIIVTDVTERETARRHAAELSRRVMDIQEDLLSHISRELHDEIGQLLTAIDLEVETVRRAMKSGKALPPDGLDRIKTVTHSAVDAVRGLCTSLRSPVIDDIGLAAVMETHINDFREHTGIDTEFECAIETSGVSPEAGLGLFRITQEALTNVARHAHAEHVKVSLYRDNGRTVLEISDDGQGFDPDKGPSHLSGGLLGMRERTRILGGELTIESNPGKGTRVRVSPPPLSGEKEAPL